MSFAANFPLFMIVSCLFSAALCMLLSRRAAYVYTVIFSACLTVADIPVLLLTHREGSITYTMGEFPAPWGNEIRFGVLECTVLFVFLIVILCSLLAGGQYLWKQIDASKTNLYCSLLNLVTAATCALVFTNDIFTGYVFLEIMTLASCGLLVSRERGHTTLAGIRYMIINLLGSGLYLLGVILLYAMTGHLLLVPIRESVEVLITDPSQILSLTFAVGVLTLGLTIKSGLFPFYFWMPDTYSRSTPTTASVMSSVVSKAYIFLLIKIYLRALGPDVIGQLPIHRILLVLGIAAIIFGSLSALHEAEINRMIAYSSAAQIGYIYMSIGLGTEAGYMAAILHLLAHTVTKSLLFLTTPHLADVSGGSFMFHDLTGAGLRNQRAGLAFVFASLSMIGIPVFAGFSSKFQIMTAALGTDDLPLFLCVVVVLAVSTLLNVLYFMRTVIRLYTRKGSGAEEADTYDLRAAHPGILSRLYIVPAGILLAAGFFLGIFPDVTVTLLNQGLNMFL